MWTVILVSVIFGALGIVFLYVKNIFNKTTQPDETEADNEGGGTETIGSSAGAVKVGILREETLSLHFCSHCSK